MDFLYSVIPLPHPCTNMVLIFQIHMPDTANELKEELKKYYLEAPPSSLENWQTYSNDYFSVIMYTCQYNGLYLCSLIDLNFFALEEYASLDNSLHICFFDHEQILSNLEEMKLLGISQNDLAKSPKLSFSQPQVIDTLALKIQMYPSRAVCPSIILVVLTSRLRFLFLLS